MRTIVRTAPVVVVLLVAAACGGSSSSGTAAPTPSGTATPSPTSPTPSPTPTSASPSPTPSPIPSPSPAGPAGCRLGDLRFTVSGGDAAMGSVYSQIVMTNTGGTPCVTGGYGGVSYVDASGGQVGAPAQRDHGRAVTRIVLAPGQRAKAQLQESQALNYPAATCKPVRVSGLRIYPPNETRSVVVKHSATGCSSAAVKTLSLQAYRKG